MLPKVVEVEGSPVQRSERQVRGIRLRACVVLLIVQVGIDEVIEWGFRLNPAGQGRKHQVKIKSANLNLLKLIRHARDPLVRVYLTTKYLRSRVCSATTVDEWTRRKM